MTPNTWRTIGSGGDGMIKSIFIAIVFSVIGFVLSCVVISFLVGDPLQLYAEQRTEKLTLLARQGSGSCSAAFGSSHIHNGFDPRVFDQSLRGRGIDVTSVNLAVEGGSQTEQFAMAKNFLATRAQTPARNQRCIVVLEANAGANFQNRHLVHPRAINIYDKEVAAVGLAFISPSLPVRRKLGRLAFVLAATTMHYLNVGTLANKIFVHAEDKDLLQRETDADRRGFLVEPPIPRDTAAVEESFRSKPQVPRSVGAALAPGPAALVSELLKVPNGNRVEYVYIVSPKLDDLVQFETYPDCVLVDGMRIRIVNVAQPPAYPNLYRQELWHDPNHLNASGAAEFTRSVAEQLADGESSSAPGDTCTSG
jgi:hypothetical protein